ncbi:hypothetical protein D3C87_1359370 [compost metagenome]
MNTGFFFLIVVGDIIDARTSLAGNGLSPLHLNTSQILNLKGDMLQDMAHPGTFLQPFNKSASIALGTCMRFQTWYNGQQLFFESRNQIGRLMFKILKIKFNPDCRFEAVKVGT